MIHRHARAFAPISFALAAALSGLVRAGAAVAQAPPPAAGPLAARYKDAADRLIDAALADSTAYWRLGRMADEFGGRLSGSPNLERAIDWVLAEMRKDGLADVHALPVLVPHWVRGRESAELVRPRPHALHMLGLGGSVGTPAAGITAPVLVVGSFDELTRRAAEAKGKIVLFDVPFSRTLPPFKAYEEAVQYRVNGPSAAARVGARACLIRSVASFSIQSPHTGVMHYDSTAARIPAAALSVEDAELLHRLQDRGEPVVVRLRMEARTLPDAPSRDVVAEVRGSERPDEVVVVGGHIDAWDVGEGAMDDGGGALSAWQAVRLMQRLGLRPRRTVRVVLWTNEENGSRGALGYRDHYAANLGKHVLAIESDNGVFAPTGFGVVGSPSALAVAQQIGPLLQRIGAGTIEAAPSGPEADVAPLAERGVPAMGLEVDASRYFWYHHSTADTFDKINAGEMGRCVAALAVMAYVAADLPDPLPR
jgi:carboxypeptidase Q